MISRKEMARNNNKKKTAQKKTRNTAKNPVINEAQLSRREDSDREAAARRIYADEESILKADVADEGMDGTRKNTAVRESDGTKPAKKKETSGSGTEGKTRNPKSGKSEAGRAESTRGKGRKSGRSEAGRAESTRGKGRKSGRSEAGRAESAGAKVREKGTEIPEKRRDGTPSENAEAESSKKGRTGSESSEEIRKSSEDVKAGKRNSRKSGKKKKETKKSVKTKTSEKRTVQTALKETPAEHAAETASEKTSSKRATETASEKTSAKRAAETASDRASSAKRAAETKADKNAAKRSGAQEKSKTTGKRAAETVAKKTSAKRTGASGAVRPAGEPAAAKKPFKLPSGEALIREFRQAVHFDKKVFAGILCAILIVSIILINITELEEIAHLPLTDISAGHDALANQMTKDLTVQTQAITAIEDAERAEAEAAERAAMDEAAYEAQLAEQKAAYDRAHGDEKDLYNTMEVRDPDELRMTLVKNNAYAIGDSMIEGMNDGQYVNTESLIFRRGCGTYDSQDLFERAVNLQASVVWVQLGLNDMDMYHSDSGQFKDNYRKLVQYLQDSLPDCRIFLCNINPISEDACRRHPQYEYAGQYNQAIMELCEELGVSYVDNTTLVLGHPELWDSDGIHPVQDVYLWMLSHMCYEAGI